LVLEPGPSPQLWANTLATARGLWGAPLMAAMEDYNHRVGLKIAGDNRVTLADDKDQYGLPIARVE
jgi:hypothetical protein